MSTYIEPTISPSAPRLDAMAPRPDALEWRENGSSGYPSRHIINYERSNQLPPIRAIFPHSNLARPMAIQDLMNDDEIKSRSDEKWNSRNDEKRKYMSESETYSPPISPSSSNPGKRKLSTEDYLSATVSQKRKHSSRPASPRGQTPTVVPITNRYSVSPMSTKFPEEWRRADEDFSGRDKRQTPLRPRSPARQISIPNGVSNSSPSPTDTAFRRRGSTYLAPPSSLHGGRSPLGHAEAERDRARTLPSLLDSGISCFPERPNSMVSQNNNLSEREQPSTFSDYTHPRKFALPDVGFMAQRAPLQEREQPPIFSTDYTFGPPLSFVPNRPPLPSRPFDAYAQPNYAYGYQQPRGQSFSGTGLHDRSPFSSGYAQHPFHDAYHPDISHDSKQRKRRGNLPKETTDKLRSWFIDHLAHPYPTEDEKQELLRQTGLQINQISNWFINARRRQLPTLMRGVDAENAARNARNTHHGPPGRVLQDRDGDASPDEYYDGRVTIRKRERESV